MKVFVLLALTLCLSLAAIRTQAAAPELAAPAQTSYDKLHDAEFFALGGVGYAGTTSDNELAYRELAADPNAVAAFVALIDDESASKAGQLYALLGLQAAGDAQFEARLPAFLADDSPVTEMSGCILMPVKVSAIARQIAERAAPKKAAQA